jgi:hypothetical protein
MIPMFAQVATQVAPQVIDVPSHALGWGTLSLINAGLAQSKDRSGLFWWLVSLVLGPVATFLIVAILDKPEVEFTPQKVVPHDDLS